MGRMTCGRATMGQRKIDLELHNDGIEHGFTVCQDMQGNFAKGPETTGHKYGVQIDVSCPAGFKPSSLWHSHPGGTTDPSPQDIREGCRLGFRHLCISVPEREETVCHDISRRCRR